jgi:raffinose/stachyose/melibiose transport system substrate-binding protein
MIRYFNRHRAASSSPHKGARVKGSKVIAGAAVLTAAAFVLSGCTGGAPSGDSAAGDGKVVNYLIGQPDPSQLAAVKANLANFTKESGVKVNLQILPGGGVTTLIQTRLRSGNGPDVFGYDTGVGNAGVLAKAGLLYNLTSHAKSANWPIYSWTKPSVTFGGKFYGIPDQIEELGIFYNKDLFSQLHLPAPSTMADLNADAAALKKDGKIAFAAGDKDGWEGGHMLSMALSSRAGSKATGSLVTNKSSWDTSTVQAAAGTWSDFVKDGYLPPSPDAVTYDNSNSLFYSGKAGMDPTGTWLVADMPKLPFNVGFVHFPSPTGAGIPATDLGGGTFMSSSSKHVTAALKLLDYLVGPANGKWEINHELIPAYPVSTAGITNPLFQFVVNDTAGYAKAGTADNVGYNIDVNETDVFNQAMYNGMQGLLNLQTTPGSLASSLQAAAAKSK